MGRGVRLPQGGPQLFRRKRCRKIHNSPSAAVNTTTGTNSKRRFCRATRKALKSLPPGVDMRCKQQLLYRIIAVSVTLIATVLPGVGQDFTIHMKMDDGSEGATYYVSS